MKPNHVAPLDAYLEPWAPHWAAAIAEAAAASDPAPALRAMLSTIGFDGLSCIVVAMAASGGERLVYHWSTAPDAWSQRYASRGYLACDLRVALTRNRLSPAIWDAADARSDWPARRFHADAARHGIRSGVAVSFRDAPNARIVVALDSAASPLTPVRCARIAVQLGDLMLLGAALHERVLLPRCKTVAARSRRGRDGLTRRERECLCMAANGLTSADIAAKLGIAQRTVGFHLRHVFQKLGALNRPEAIAKAAARGMLGTGAIAQRSV
jgi:LuxR family quorum-sensing system transcriptional regulator SolR